MVSPQLVPQKGAGAEGARPPLSLQVRTQPSNKTGGAANKSCLYNSSKEACKSKSNSSYAHYGTDLPKFKDRSLKTPPLPKFKVRYERSPATVTSKEGYKEVIEEGVKESFKERAGKGGRGLVHCIAMLRRSGRLMAGRHSNRP